MWQERVEVADWTTIGAELDEHGRALIGSLRSPAEAGEVAGRYFTPPEVTVQCVNLASRESTTSGRAGGVAAGRSASFPSVGRFID